MREQEGKGGEGKGVEWSGGDGSRWVRRKGEEEERGKERGEDKEGKEGGSHCKTFSFRAMEVSYWVSQESKEMLGVGLRMEMGSK